MSQKNEGVWIPEGVFNNLISQRLHSRSWNVLLTMAYQQYRYGGVEARITLPKVAERTGLSLSTVKRSVQELRQKGVIVKIKRGCWRLGGVNVLTPPIGENVKSESANMLTPSKGHDPDPYPILLFSLLEIGTDTDQARPFSPKQIQTLEDVLGQLYELYGQDVVDLRVPSASGGDAPRTYRGWLQDVQRTGNKKQAGLFIRAMLALTQDERVIGRELTS